MTRLAINAPAFVDLMTPTRIALLFAVTATLALAVPPPALADGTVLGEGQWSGGNPLPPGPFGFEATVLTFEVPAGLDHLHADFVRSHESMDVFAANARLYAPDGTLADQEAFSDAQVGNWRSTGTAQLRVDAPEAGIWRAVYLNDGLDPTGTHTVTVVASGA